MRDKVLTRSRGPRLFLFAAMSAAAVVVAGCSGPGAGIADRIRAANSPIVREVRYIAPNPWEGGEELVYIDVLDGTTEAEALDLWCDVAVPAGIEQLRPEQSGVWTGFETRADGVVLGGTRLLPMDSSCLGGTRPPLRSDRLRHAVAARIAYIRYSPG